VVPAAAETAEASAQRVVAGDAAAETPAGAVAAVVAETAGTVGTNALASNLSYFKLYVTYPFLSHENA
jgi:hypothetical protein